EMRQIAQRITGRYHLEPLSKEDTGLYVRHRLSVAGAQSEVFDRAAIRALYRRSGGIPRLINVIADRALLAGYTRDQRAVDLALWGGTYEPGRADACEQAARAGLQCLTQRNGSLGKLRRLNWPAVLTLVDESGAEHPVLIASLHQSAAQVVANGKTFELPLAELTYHWYGEHVLLWRPGIPQPKDLAPGARDAGVLWLRETLARIRGENPPENPSPFYDAELETRVREYQRERMLKDDGIVGAPTQVAMIADLDVPGTPL